MSNMSYCRFENTASDLADCLYAMEEALEDGETLSEMVSDNKYELAGLSQLRGQAEKFLELYDMLGGK